MAFRKRTYGRKKKNVRRRYGGPVKRAVRKAKTKMFNKRVLRAVSRTTETKVVSAREDNQSVYPLTSADAGNGIFVVSPGDIGTLFAVKIVQGTAQGERIGNKISPVRCTLKGVIRPNPFYDATVNYNPGPMYVVLWVVSLAKHLNDDKTTLQGVISNSFFEDGNVSRGFTGVLIDLTATVNRAHVTVHNRRVFKLGAADYVSAFGTGASNNVGQRYANNDFSMSKMFSLRLKMPKTIRFNDNSSNPASMRRWWMFAVPYRVDGQQFQTSTGNYTGPVPVLMDFALDLKFKDA